jgi:hypothetical protein
MERDSVQEVKPTAKIKAEALNGLQNLRLHLIEQGAEINKRPPGPDPVQRAEGNLAFILYAVSPVVLEIFKRRWKSLDFGSLVQKISGDSFRYTVDMSQGTPRGKVVIPSRSSADIVYGSITYESVELDNRTLEDRWEKGLNRHAIRGFGNLSRGQIIRKFEKAIR